MNKWFEDLLAPLYRGQRRFAQTDVLVEKRQEARLELDEAIDALARARARKADENGA